MVAERRFGPLIAVLLCVLGVLLLRLFHVQVLEHEVWAGEAAALVRSSRLLPSHRGKILDREGRVLVEDEDVWRVDLVYRDFRRGHPLGLVAHSRSTLEMRAVPLPEALSHLEAWAKEIVQLSPADLDRFAKGGALATATLSIPAAENPVRDARASRASDLRFYAAAFLDLGKQDREAIGRAEKQEPRSARSYAEIVAAERSTTSSALLADLEGRLSKQRETLSQLAGLLSTPERPGGESLDSLVAGLEAARERFEDTAADELFEEATRFSPGRISSTSLARAFELGWIAHILRWDPARTRAWAASRRAAFERDLAEVFAPRILARAGLEDGDSVAECLLDQIAAFYARGAPPESWRDLDEACVLSEIATLFDLPRRPHWEGEKRPALPLLERDFREAAEKSRDPWLALGTLADMAGASLDGSAATRNARVWAARWRAIAKSDRHLEGKAAQEALLAILSALEARALAASDAGFEACLATASPGVALAGPLPVAHDRIDRALQKERFLLKDLSSRSASLVPEASYPLVHLIERHAEVYRGFEVRPATRRIVRARGADGLLVAGALLGGVRGPSLRDLVAQEADTRRLRTSSLGAAWDDEEIADLASRLVRTDDKTGSSGVEGYFDAELRGRNGWFETSGLEELDEDRSHGVLKAAVDGKDLRLTLDRDLQLAAQETLAHPAPPADEATDRVWFQNPVGAIVLITPDGEVLAAASEPTRDGEPPAPGRDLERTHARERTLKRPTFNPPGSVFKPFVAAYALDRLGLDPGELLSCQPLGDGGSGYKSMHCHASPHGQSNLARALEVSCNAAFAQIGERYAPEQLIEMADLFGFGRPTGIRHLSGGDRERRAGLSEDYKLAGAEALPRKLREPAERMRFANGLGLIEATPMQVARATAGLLTGRLPDLRIAREVGGEPVEKAARDLPISQRAREIVCRALEAVVKEPGGTAYGKGLDRASLGFSFACKTGSADKRPLAPEAGGSDVAVRGQLKMLKQTWIAGWFPVEAPKAILVVMLHDVSETSNHTSVYVAAQFLRSPAVRKFVEGGEPGEVAR